MNAYGLKDGTYVATFTTDNKMFHVNEANEDMGILTVENGEMTIHVSLQSKKIVNLFPGTAEDAQKDGAVLLEPTVDTVTYSDGISSEVYGFDIPVPAIDEEFDVALIGTHDNWYTHKVVVSNPVPGNDISEFLSTNTSEEATDYASMVPADSAVEAVSIEGVEDGTYTVEVAMEGGTGRASITSPTGLYVVDGKAYAQIEWSSPNYDYMLVDGERFDPINEDGNSVFLIPVTAVDEAMDVVGDTTAMSEAHEIDYTLTFDSASISAADMTE
ncbi:MAG: iron transporter [Eubacterium sp.]|nr:iron transporter [Eubacterium sp.]